MPRGVSMKTPDNVARARRLRAEGKSLWQVAQDIGGSVQTISAWMNDPDGALLRARKDSYAGTCGDCGGPTDGSSGRSPARRCARCIKRIGMLETKWDQAKIIEAIREWASVYGVPPTAMQWNVSAARLKGRDDWAERYANDYRQWPAQSVVQSHFPSWNEAIRAAGFSPRDRRGESLQSPPQIRNAGVRQPGAAGAGTPFDQALRRTA